MTRRKRNENESVPAPIYIGFFIRSMLLYPPPVMCFLLSPFLSCLCSLWVSLPSPSLFLSLSSVCCTLDIVFFTLSASSMEKLRAYSHKAFIFLWCFATALPSSLWMWPSGSALLNVLSLSHTHKLYRQLVQPPTIEETFYYICRFPVNGWIYLFDTQIVVAAVTVWEKIWMEMKSFGHLSADGDCLEPSKPICRYEMTNQFNAWIDSVGYFDTDTQMDYRVGCGRIVRFWMSVIVVTLWTACRHFVEFSNEHEKQEQHEKYEMKIVTLFSMAKSQMTCVCVPFDARFGVYHLRHRSHAAATRHVRREPKTSITIFAIT